MTKQLINNGIIGLFEKYPDTAKTLKALAQDILRGPGSLSYQEREMIAVYVSAKNRCYFCSQSHAAIAMSLGAKPEIVQKLLQVDISTLFPERLRYLLLIADYAAENRYLPLGLLTMTESAGVLVKEVHDAVLIASAFSMFNRYVDLLSQYPVDPGFYEVIGKEVAEKGYL